MTPRCYVWPTVAAIALCAIARAQIPMSPGAATDRDFLKVRLAWQQAGLLDDYKRVGEHGAWDKDAETFLSGCGRKYAADESAPTLRALQRQGRALRDAGCTDPMVLYSEAFVLHNLNDPEAAARLADANDRLSKSRYPAWRKASGIIRLMLQAQGAGDKASAEALSSRAVDAAGAAIDARDFSTIDRRLVFRWFEPLIDNELPMDAADRLMKRVERSPEIDEWTISALKGLLAVRKVWDARGTDFAPDVKPAQWRGFEKYLGEANTALRRAYELDHSRPETAYYMIRVAMGGAAPEGETPRLWFDRAVKAQLDYMPAYAALRWALRPRWGGSHAEILRFGRECAATKRYDTWVPQAFLEAVIEICDDSDDYESIWRKPGIADTARDVLLGTAADPAHVDDAAWCKSRLVGVYWRARRYDEAIALLKELGESFDDDGVLKLGIDARELRDDCAVRASDVATQARDAALAAKAGDWPRALKLCEDALAACAPDDARARAVLKNRAAIAGAHVQFERGDWVEPDVSAASPLVREIYGSWIRQDRSTARCTAKDEGPWLRWEIPVGDRWESTVEIDLGEVQENPKSNVNGGFRFSRFDKDEPSRDNTRCGIYRDYGAIGFRNVLDPGHSPASPVKPGPNALRLVVWDGRALVFVNSANVFRGAVPRTDPGTDPVYLGVGESVPSESAPVTFSHWRIRRLLQQPPELQKP